MPGPDRTTSRPAPVGATGRRFIAVLLFLLVALGAWPKDVVSASFAALPADSPVVGSVPMYGRDADVVKYSLRIPDDAFALTLEISNSPADLDIVVSEVGGDVIAYSETVDYNETLFLSMLTDPLIPSGTVTVEVTYQLKAPPVVGGVSLRKIPFTLVARFVRTTGARPITVGATMSSRLEPDHGMMDIYTVDVPREAPALRVDVIATDGDLDVFANRGTAPADPFTYANYSQTLRSTETLVIDRSSVPALSDGRYYIMILDQLSLDSPVDYSFIVTFADAPPPSLVGIQPLAIPGAALEKALLATVELSTADSGGSGCLVSPDGYILTNWHVVRSPSGEPADDIIVGMSVDTTRPPAELFHADVVAYSSDRDLALLRVTTGRYGTPVPATYVFPYHAIRTAPAAIAEHLQFIGYPTVGGTGSRASVTYTQGVVAGFQRTEYGTMIKTDGEINSGNSGGAALDADLRLVGLPTSVVGEDSGQLAYVVPVSAIPESWLRMFE